MLQGCQLPCSPCSHFILGCCLFPVGNGPCASCKHIGTLCYALEEFSRLKKVPDFITCTEKLDKLNKTTPKTLDVIPVAMLTARCEIEDKDSHSQHMILGHCNIGKWNTK